MIITRQPESLCLTGNMASIRVATDTDITMTLTCRRIVDGTPSDGDD